MLAGGGGIAKVPDPFPPQGSFPAAHGSIDATVPFPVSFFADEAKGMKSGAGGLMTPSGTACRKVGFGRGPLCVFHQFMNRCGNCSAVVSLCSSEPVPVDPGVPLLVLVTVVVVAAGDGSTSVDATMS
eukprot:7267223-Alexandrium_andersonii.AAC.1